MIERKRLNAMQQQFGATVYANRTTTSKTLPNCSSDAQTARLPVMDDGTRISMSPRRVVSVRQRRTSRSSQSGMENEDMVRAHFDSSSFHVILQGGDRLSRHLRSIARIFDERAVSARSSSRESRRASRRRDTDRGAFCS